MAPGGLYYEICALPMLSLGEIPPLSVAEFMAFCASRLPADLSAALEAVSLEPGRRACCRADREWQQWETAIRNGMASIRSEFLGIDASRWLRYEKDVFPSDVALLKGIFELENPLSRQEALDALRWRELDNLTVGHEFEFDDLVVYKLKLLLACRWADIPGQDIEGCFNRLVEHGLEEALKQREIVEPSTAM